MKKQIFAAALLTISLISGCGSSGSGTTNQTGVGKSVIAGAVADGYLVNATVFLDKNRNYQLDQDEAFTTTKDDGSYVLNLDTTDLDSNGKLKYPVVALAIAQQTYDLDDPTHTPLSKSYVMSMHAVSVTPTASGGVTGSVKNFISPISTQIREMMESGTYATVEDATEALRAKLGMPPTTNMLANYIANSNSSMHTAARNMAGLMGEQMAQVMPGNRLDVNRYRGMMGTIFSNISSVKGPNSNPEMSTLMEQLRANLSNIPPGQPFRNMSAAFRGGMMGRAGMR
ncbi:MAG: hypothetical protein PHF56_00480 [Desulfuromonadaceae bacterium]|nr:hypothetical protein [Desulfuromonadaceae bacterium]